MFLWLLAHRKLLTNHERCRRIIALQVDYSSCWADKEDEMHAIRDCKTTKEIWELVSPPDLVSNFFTLGTKEWLEASLKRSIRTGVEEAWPVRMVLIC